MRIITTRSGAEVRLDGDLLAVIEALDRELTRRHGLDRTFEDMMREIRHLIDQMSDDDRRTYLIESLFLNTVTYENEKAGVYLRKLMEKQPGG